MASIHKHCSGIYRIRFRLNGQNVNRSLRTRELRQARAACTRIEETLHLISTARLELPRDRDAITYVLNDGRTQPKVTATKNIGLKALFDLYHDRLPHGSKEESTLEGEAIHLKHFFRHLGPGRVVESISKSDLQQYVEKRLATKHHGKFIRPDTVRKELVTFRMLWNWAVGEGVLEGITPTKRVVLPLTDERPPFRMRSEIEAIISRGGLSKESAKQLWESLYLSTTEIDDLLQVIQKNARLDFTYPMSVFVAHTGARRSEMIRSQPEDIDFSGRTVLLREKKKSRSKGVTYRRIDMSPLLLETMQNWMASHPGGQRTFCVATLANEVKPLTTDLCFYHFKQALAKSDWSVVRGFHVFRHSFASNLAASGVDEYVIDEFMGHQTVEMRRRYRHLFPGQSRAAIEAVFGRSPISTKIPSTT